ncbi:MAG TPA: OB-fold nucleic acid binding domain-containing protein, partial [Longimicrobiales bacterium]|nr:OB-fold nucleic acid binding domain-containing protein [Longimicrobiales bacterium]
MSEAPKVLRDRRQALEALRARGIEPYAYGFRRSHRAGEAADLFRALEEAGDLDDQDQGPEVRLGGRLVSWRGHGKSAFANLEDGSGEIQLYFRVDVLGEESFRDLDLLDLGDWIGVEGPLFRTRMGEVTVRARGWELLSKSLRPLPRGKVEVDEETGERTSHSAFSDTEARYRQRYADLAVNPEVREVFRIRSRMIAALRAFLDERGFLEVETP